MSEKRSLLKDYPVNKDYDSIVEKINIFFQTNETDIVSFYKAWVMGFGFSNAKNRIIPSIINVAFIRENGGIF